MRPGIVLVCVQHSASGSTAGPKACGVAPISAGRPSCPHLCRAPRQAMWPSACAASAAPHHRAGWSRPPPPPLPRPQPGGAWPPRHPPQTPLLAPGTEPQVSTIPQCFQGARRLSCWLGSWSPSGPPLASHFSSSSEACAAEAHLLETAPHKPLHDKNATSGGVLLCDRRSCGEGAWPGLA